MIKAHHNAATFTPYDPADTLGATGPTSPLQPKPKKNQCGVMGQVIIAAIAIAVMATLRVPMTNFFTGLFQTAAGPVSLTSGAAAASGMAAVATAQTAGAVAGAVTAAGVGSAVSQFAGVQMGIQDKFSWNAVGMTALSAGVGAGLGLAGVGGFTGAAAGSAIAQGIGRITGMQDRFSWAGVAAAGIGASMGGGPAASLIANAAARSLIDGTDFGDAIIAALPDVIGSTIGEAIAGGVVRRSQSNADDFLAEANGRMQAAWDEFYGAPVGGHQLAQGDGTIVPGGRTAILSWTDDYGPHSLTVGAYSSDYVVAIDGEGFYNKSISGGANSRIKPFSEYIKDYYASQGISNFAETVVVTGRQLTAQDILVEDISYGMGAIVGSAVSAVQGILSAANYVLDGVGSVMFGLQEGVNRLLPGERTNPYRGYWDRYQQTSSAVGGFVGKAFANPTGLWNDITTDWAQAEAQSVAQNTAFMRGYTDPFGTTFAGVATGGVGAGRSALRPVGLPKPPPQPPLLPQGVLNNIAGRGREAFIRGELARKYPSANIQNEVYLRTHNGQRAIDPLTGEGRRIDSVVIQNGRVLDSVEISSPTARKFDQQQKEARIRSAGGTFVLDSATGSLVDISQIPTRLVRIP